MYFYFIPPFLWATVIRVEQKGIYNLAQFTNNSSKNCYRNMKTELFYNQMFDYCSSSCCFYFFSLCHHEKPQYTGVYLLLNAHFNKTPTYRRLHIHIHVHKWTSNKQGPVSSVYLLSLNDHLDKPLDNAISRGRRGSDCMVFVCTSTYATGAYSMYLSY